MKKVFNIIVFLLVSFSSFAGKGYFVENKGQLPSEVLFHSKLNSGDIYITQKGFKIKVLDPIKFRELWSHPQNHSKTKHQHNHLKSYNYSRTINGHVFDIEIKGAELIKENAIALNQLSHKINILKGNNPNQWGQNLTPITDLKIVNIKSGVDLRIYFQENSLKYEFILNKATDPIILEYKGVNTELNNNKVTILTSVGNIVDENLISFSASNPSKHIPTAFLQIKQNTFELSPQEVTEFPFIIDPQLNFSTYSGSTADNWGYTATYDEDGYAYGGGIDFSGGYPTATGAFQDNYGGGNIDIAISKFSPDGQSLIYATYIGGLGSEAPHSMIVNSKNQLIIYGVTSSTNYPTSSNAYDLTFNGGSYITASNVLEFNGSDIIITVLNQDGSGIIGSTYYGGSENDALNDPNQISGLYRNYADLYRGEVNVDGNDNIIISSVTESADLPTPNGFQTSFGGGNQDGCIAKFNSNVSNIIWGSYYGGSGDDACYASKQNSLGETYITGGTTSSDLPNSISGNTYSGSTDGFLAKISSNGSALISTRYVGTNHYDQSYFVEVDYDDDVYCYGQSLGTMPVTSNVYSNPNSGQFIQKLSGDLTNILAATTVGSGSNKTDLVPSAFMVSNCKEVYLSGWGGLVNGDFNGTNGLETTSGAFQSSTDGSDFYFMLLGQNFSTLKYATYFGGGSTEEHVDGGTSRFDRDGTIYQGVCAGCGGSSAFPTTPSAYAENNGSFNCNLAVIKMDISKLTANIQFQKDSTHCQNTPITFYNQSTGGTEYKWIFPDGSTSDDYDAEYYFPETGNYEVKLVAIDSVQCPYSDTADISVEVITIPTIDIELDTFLCENETLNIEVVGGPDDENYSWWTGKTFFPSNNNTLAISPDKTTQYFASYTNKCGTDTVDITIPVYFVPESNTFIDTVCFGEEFKVYYPVSDDVILTEENNYPYTLAEDTLYMNISSSDNFIFLKEGNCGTGRDTFNINHITVDYDKSEDTTVCAGARAKIEVKGNVEVQWQSELFDSSKTDPIQIFNPTISNSYPVIISNGTCSVSDTIKVYNHPKPFQDILSDYTIYFGEKLEFSLNPNFKYEWTPNLFLTCNNCPSTTSEPQNDIDYTIRYIDSAGCVVIDTIDVNVIFPLYVPNVFSPNGDGKNDIFYAFTHKVDKFEMKIFNRWGQLIFETQDYNTGWDGTYNGEPQQQDTYVYKINYTPAYTNLKKEKVGRVSLIR